MKKLKRPVAILLTIVLVISMMNLTVFAEEDDQSPVVNADGLAGTEESVPVCGLEESQGHSHDESCYTTEQVLTCGIPENHVHTVDCYQLGDPDFGKGTEMEIDGQWYLVDHIICEIPEGHVHTDVCYEEQQVLICGLEESEGHTHTEECYVTPEITETVTPEIVEPAEEPAPVDPEVTEPEVAESVEPETIEELPQGDEPWGLAYGNGGSGSGGSRAGNDGWDRAHDAYFYILKPNLGEFPTNGKYDGLLSQGKWESAGRGKITVKNNIEPSDISSRYWIGESSVDEGPDLKNITIEVGGIIYTYGERSSDHYYTVEWKYAIGANTSQPLCYALHSKGLQTPDYMR